MGLSGDPGRGVIGAIDARATGRGYAVGMTIETPVWLQNGDYPARLDRHFIEQVMAGRERVFDGLAVSENTPSPNTSVRVSAGAAVVEGDDQADQGFYFVRSTAVETVDCGSPPGSGSRTDYVYLRVNDPQATGPAGDNATLEVGTSIPDTAVGLCSILRTAGEGGILDANITDIRPLGPFPYGVGTGGPPSTGVDGDLYVQVS